MTYIEYAPKKFKKNALAIIGIANSILEEYAQQSLDLTLRQLYYQFVSRGYIPNNDREYKRLGDVVSDGRLAGLIPWDRIVDRTRFLRKNSHWDGPEAIVSTCAQQFQVDRWKGQKKRVEIWIEKDALVGVIEKICREFDVGYFSCRGYVSQSEMWQASQRIIEREDMGIDTVVIHLGDHDPSGIDMTRDIQDRLTDTFLTNVSVQRVALTMDQVVALNPPPNPAKVTDSRANSYIEQYGDESWELDALDPKYINNLIRESILEHLDEAKFKEMKEQELEGRRVLTEVSKNWGKLTKKFRKKTP